MTVKTVINFILSAGLRHGNREPIDTVSTISPEKTNQANAHQPSRVTMSIPESFRLSLNLPKIEGKGEDADPLLMSTDSTTGLVGVFDGMGGAGSTTYILDDESYSGAYIASRLVKDTVAEFFSSGYMQKGIGAPQTCSMLQQRIVNELQQAVAGLDAPASKLKSKLIKNLPTTMAIAYFGPIDDKQNINVIWAGDSRCYSLDPASGLRQLSTDDLKTEGDALDNLKSDSPLSNSVNADEDFHLNLNSLTVDLPVIILAATDGCFGFLYTPTHFEFLLVDTLLEAESVEHWKALIIDRLQKTTGDDASLSLIALGWASFEQIKISFAGRRDYISREFIGPMDELTEKLKTTNSTLQELEREKQQHEQNREKLRQELWHKYKPNYSGFLAVESEHTIPGLEVFMEAEPIRHTPDKLTLRVRSRAKLSQVEEQ